MNSLEVSVMGDLIGMGPLQWTAVFHLIHQGNDYLDDFCFGPFYSPVELANWRSKFLKSIIRICPGLSLNFSIRLIFQMIGNCTADDLLEFPIDPDLAAENFLSDY